MFGNKATVEIPPKVRNQDSGRAERSGDKLTVLERVTTRQFPLFHQCEAPMSPGKV